MASTGARLILESGVELDHTFFDSDISDAESNFKDESESSKETNKRMISIQEAILNDKDSSKHNSENEFSYKADFNESSFDVSPAESPKKDSSSEFAVNSQSFENGLAKLQRSTSKLKQVKLTDFKEKNSHFHDDQNIQELVKMLSIFDKKLKSSHFRPKWCDPTSTKLPSDHLATIAEVMAYYADTFSNKSDKRFDPTSKANRRSRSHNFINRRKELEKIQNENYMIAKRLQNVKPTRELCRDEQLRSYMHLYREEYIPHSYKTSRPSTSRAQNFISSSQTSSISSNPKWSDLVSNNYHFQCTNRNCCLSSRTSGKTHLKNKESPVAAEKIDYPVVVVPYLPPLVQGRRKKK